MNYNDSLKLLTSQEKFYINPGLDRIKKVADILDNPQDSFKVIHIAGTNGKGSTCAMLAKILEENGLRTGLYTSPHIKNYTERIKINFNDIPENDFANYVERVETASKKAHVELTEFEILTLSAFLYFKDGKVDFAVIETGMGGRLDATNIVKPILTMITSISKDHTDRLGSTIEKISAEKAGIIKKDIPVIIAEQNLGFGVIKKQAEVCNAPLYSAVEKFKLTDIEKNIFSDNKNHFSLSLRGINQGENLALVLKACEILGLKPFNALENVIWHGRFEYIKDKNLLVDAGHNPDGIRLLKKNLDVYFPNKKRVFLFGMLNTKDYKTAVSNLFQDDDEVYVTDNFAHNAIDKEILAQEIRKQFPDIRVKLINLQDISSYTNMSFDGIKIFCVSFYLISKIY